MSRYAKYEHARCDSCGADDITCYGLGGPDDGEFGPYDGSDVLVGCEACLPNNMRLEHIVNGNLPDPVVDKANAFLSEHATIPTIASEPGLLQVKRDIHVYATVQNETKLVASLEEAKVIIKDLLKIIETERHHLLNGGF